MAMLATYIGALCDHKDALAPGETGVLLCIAQDQRVAKIILEYIAAAFEQSPILRQLVVRRSSDTIELSNSVSIEVRPASFRKLRGPTYIAVIADEAAYWFNEEHNANPDTEIIAAVKPGLLTTGGPLIIASSPYAKRGVLWDVYKKHYGPQGNPGILVAQGATRALNPSIPQAEIDIELEQDRVRNTAEYLAEFRADIEGFVTLDVVEACIGDYHEQMPVSGVRYSAFTDPSGGSSDSMTLAITHRDKDQIAVIDAVRERRPPFSPEDVVNEFAALCKSYRITKVVGDRYGGEFPRELFRKHEINYELVDQVKSDLFRDFLPLLNSRRVVLPRHEPPDQSILHSGAASFARRQGHHSARPRWSRRHCQRGGRCGAAGQAGHLRSAAPLGSRHRRRAGPRRRVAAATLMAYVSSGGRMR